MEKEKRINLQDQKSYTLSQENLLALLKDFYGIMNATPASTVLHDFENGAKEILFGDLSEEDEGILKDYCFSETGSNQDLVTNPPKIELLADKQHDIWSHWMKYLFSKCFPQQVPSPSIQDEQNKSLYTGNLIIPKESVERWNKQVNTPYAQLSEKEKESDREQVRKFIDLI